MRVHRPSGYVWLIDDVGFGTACVGYTGRMTAQNPHAISRPLPSDEARRLVVDLEHRGLDSSLITIDSEPPLTKAEIGSADGEMMARAGRRVIVGLIAGLAVGLAAGATFGLLYEVSLGITTIAGAIMGLAVGALIGLYSRLGMSRELVDVEGPGLSTIVVDLTELDDAVADDVRALIAYR